MIKIDFNKKCGSIKPLHGVGGGPVTGNFRRDHTKEFADARIPYARLHDIEGAYGGTYYVDVPNIFRNFSLDPTDEKNYNFELTDLYMKAVCESGAEPFYRLGITIEHSPIKQRVKPPADFKKWAVICEHIIRHYNEGWANGFHYGIKYWEIWNEPDCMPERDINPMWSGSPEEYYRLYEISANHLKKTFPELKIGGYGSCGFYQVTRDFGGRGEYFIDFFKGFLEYISDPSHSAPLDFFSWHIYSQSVSEIKAGAIYASEELKRYGFDKTEIILNEWNFSGVSKLNKSIVAAAMIAGNFCMMQKSPLSSAMYYDAAPTRFSYCGLFSFPEEGIEKPYYSFKAFGDVYGIGTEVVSSSDDKGIHVLASVSDDEGAVLISFYEDPEEVKLMPGFDIAGFASKQSKDEGRKQEIDFNKIEIEVDMEKTFVENITMSLPCDWKNTRVEQYILSEKHDLDFVSSVCCNAKNMDISVGIKGPTVILLKLKKISD